MATQVEANALFRSAARLIEQALAKMEVRGVPCKCCTREVFSNRRDAKIYEQVNGMPQRLRDVAKRLEEKDLEAQQPMIGFTESLADFHKGATR